MLELDLQNKEKLENFLDFYVENITKLLKPSYIANRYMKMILNIPAKDIMLRHISKENKELRKDLSTKFLKIIRERKYEMEANFFTAP